MTDKKDTATPLPFAETTPWAACHMGRAKAIRDAGPGGMTLDAYVGGNLGADLDDDAARAPTFSGHPFCGSCVDGGRLGCCHVDGHSGPCRFSRRLP